MTYVTNLKSKTNATSDLSGGKGASLKLMTHRGLPVPPGFIITTRAWKVFDNSKRLPKNIQVQIYRFLSCLEKGKGKRFGSPNKPLLLSIRSGAKYSMPGMMDTILNVGINEKLLPALAKNLGGEIYAWDSYKRFLRMFASSVYGIHLGEFDLIDESVTQKNMSLYTLEQLKYLASAYQEFIYKRVKQRIPQEPSIQLEQAILAVFDSWYNPGAVIFRQINGIPEDLGTAVNIQVMVFGNKRNSGTGVLFTRNTQTGENEFTGDFMEMAQGEEIVRGTSPRKTLKIKDFAKKYPSQAEELFKYAKRLEKIFRDVQDIEFTIEDGRLWLLQSRSAQRSPLANIRFARDLAKEKIISPEEAFRRVKPSDIEHISLPNFEKTTEEQAEKTNLFARGISASSGAATGTIALNPHDVKRLLRQQRRTIWMNDHIDPNDLDTLMKVKAVITSKGSASSHMALIMRSSGIPGIVGCSDIKVDQRGGTISNGLLKLKAGDYISVNATLGNIYLGKLKTETKEPIPEDVTTFIKNRIKRFGRSPWSAALYFKKGAPAFTPLIKKTKKLYFKARAEWKSSKSQVIYLINHFFPKGEIISSKLIKPTDVPSLGKALQEVIKFGFYNAPRTCHYPEKLAGSPWTDGPNTQEQIEEFLNNSDYPGKYGGYLRWLKDTTLDSIVVSQEPAGKLNPRLASKHFVCTLSCLNTNPPCVVANLNLGTPHLRSLEKVEGTSLVMIKVVLNPQADYHLGNITYQIGEEYFDENKLSLLLKTLKLKTWPRIYDDHPINPPARHLAKQLIRLFPEIDIDFIEIPSLKKLLVELMSRNALPPDVYQYITDQYTLSLLNQITRQIFEKWWRPPVALPYLMAALDGVSGLSVLEAQGRFEKDTLVWFKIYGAKGSEEKERVKNWKYENKVTP